MFATTVFPPAFQRASFAVYALLQKFLMVAGLVFLIGLVGVMVRWNGPTSGTRAAPRLRIAVRMEKRFATSATPSYQTVSPEK